MLLCTSIHILLSKKALLCTSKHCVSKKLLNQAYLLKKNEKNPSEPFVSLVESCCWLTMIWLYSSVVISLYSCTHFTRGLSTDCMFVLILQGRLVYVLQRILLFTKHWARKKLQNMMSYLHSILCLSMTLSTPVSKACV